MKQLDFLIIGAQKSGTTSLRAFLETCEDIHISKRELHFWNKNIHYKDGNGVEEYLQSFPNLESKRFVGEKSPSYLNSLDAPMRIATHFPDIKLIAVLRNPIDRAYSAYWHGRRVGAISNQESFGEVIRMYQERQGKAFGDLLTPGLYTRHLDRYLVHFNLSQLCVLEFEAMINNHESELRRVHTFISENSDIAKPMEFVLPKRNVARAGRFPKFNEYIFRNRRIPYSLKMKIASKNLVDMRVPTMLEEDRDFLRNFYEREIRNVEELLQIDTSRWK